jgi:hypothetical protein
MFKKIISIVAVAGLVLALAPAAQADIVPITNGSFQDPSVTGTYGSIHNKNDTTSLPGWTVSQTNGKISIEGRFRGGRNNMAYNGDQYPNFGNGTSIISQDLGTVGAITGAGKEQLTLNFGAHRSASQVEADNRDFHAYFTLDTVKHEASALDTVVGPSGVIVGTDYSIPIDATTPTSFTDNYMPGIEHQVKLDTTGLGSGVVIGIAIANNVVNGATGGNRLALDHVTVTSGPAPPPAGTVIMFK